jgi:hypothetical protein
MHNLPFIGLLLACLSLVIFVSKSWRSFLTDLVSVAEDQWTWTTVSGEVYEDAEVVGIEVDEVVLRHRHGVSALSIDSLSIKTRDLLFRTPQWHAHVSAAPVQGKITTFSVEPLAPPTHATQAA